MRPKHPAADGLRKKQLCATCRTVPRLFARCGGRLARRLHALRTHRREIAHVTGLPLGAFSHGLEQNVALREAPNLSGPHRDGGTRVHG